MSDPVFGPVNQAVQSAKLLSGLDSCTIYALISFLSLGYIAWSKKKEMDNNQGWQDIRNKQIASEVSQTEVMKQLVTEVANMKMMLTKYLIKDN